MKFRVFVTVIVMVLVGAPVWAADTLYLGNGDKLTGKISEYSDSFVNIETHYGSFTIPVTDVSGVVTINEQAQTTIQNAITANTQPSPEPLTPLVQPVSTRDDLFTAAPLPVVTDNQDVDVQVVAQETVEDVIEKSIEEPVEERRFLGAEWSGDINLGADLKTGNSETSGIAADSSVKARWEKHRTQAKLDYNLEKDDGRTTVDNRSLGLGYDWFFADKWFLGSNAKFEQDDIDKLDLRMTLSMGLGYQAYEQDDLNLKFILSPGYIDEEFEDGSGDSSSTLNWAMDYDQKFYDDLFRLFHNHDVTGPTDDFDSFLFQSKSGLRIPIVRGIVASGQVDFDWDNNPAEGTVEDDTTYAVKLGYEW